MRRSRSPLDENHVMELALALHDGDRDRAENEAAHYHLAQLMKADKHGGQ